MRRIFTIASREYRAMVGTRAFLFTIAVMPVLMAGGSFVPIVLKKLENNHPKQLVIYDQSGEVIPALQELAKQRNEQLSLEQGDAEAAFEDSSPYEIIAWNGDEWNNEAMFELSERARKDEIHGFVQIPADITTPGSTSSVTFFSEKAALSQMRRWLDGSLSRTLRAMKLAKSDVDPSVVGLALAPVDINSKGLINKSSDGAIQEAEESEGMSSVFLPMGMMMLMFLIIFLAAQPMLEAVMEEKSDRIAEVLLGSVSAKQLLTGKLIGNVFGSLTVFVFYALGGYTLAAINGWTDFVPFSMVPAFVVYQILGVLFFSSIFMAIGSAVRQLKEAQSLLLPVWMLMFLPMFVWFNVIQEPNSIVPVALSFFPPSTPLMMILRLSTGAVIPMWQVLASVLVMLIGTAAIVLAASRIFQVGILWQGKTPKITEVLKWLFRNPMVGS